MTRRRATSGFVKSGYFRRCNSCRLNAELRRDLTVHLVSTIDEVLVLALQPVASDVRPTKKPTRPIGQVAAPSN